MSNLIDFIDISNLIGKKTTYTPPSPPSENNTTSTHYPPRGNSPPIYTDYNPIKQKLVIKTIYKKDKNILPETTNINDYLISIQGDVRLFHLNVGSKNPTIKTHLPIILYDEKNEPLDFTEDAKKTINDTIGQIKSNINSPIVYSLFNTTNFIVCHTHTNIFRFVLNMLTVIGFVLCLIPATVPSFKCKWVIIILGSFSMSSLLRQNPWF
jgi:hypothetical protein